ncbi:hypothetical protein THRCLA_07217 [Thraustotheca clavata]|uniref:Uncharacterized protein n=1 Tax=Thraustotheca clavata TaxID=74557 RepID=A0A1V9ZFC0_9STRA|nr:hypothetical protein THRCLA_07217 [Thraustotheca clavata]
MKPSAAATGRPKATRSAVVLGHQYALEAEQHAASGHLDRAEQLERMASQCYLRSMEDVPEDGKKTRAALKLIAENHEQRAVRWQMTQQSAESAPPSPQFRPSIPSPFLSPATTSKPHVQTNPAPPSGTSMQEAATEMEELFERLKALGLSGYAPNAGTKSGVYGSSRQYLSSDLGDSFCLLPTGNKMPIASRVDGETTLKAAYGNRSKNYRERYIGQLSIAPTSRLSIPSSIKEDAEIAPSPEKAFHDDEVPSTSSFASSSPLDNPAQRENLRATITQQKHEIARLTHTVKTLTAENTKLHQDVAKNSHIAEENKRLMHSMEEFKVEYNQKFLVLKRALEEWRRQQLRHDSKPQIRETDDSAMIAELKAELEAAHQEALHKDAQLKKYESWFNSLKASAKAKQQSRGSEQGSSRPTSAFSSSNLPPRPYSSTQQREL